VVASTGPVTKIRHVVGAGVIIVAAALITIRPTIVVTRT
jgi:hypothetical protein